MNIKTKITLAAVVTALLLLFTSCGGGQGEKAVLDATLSLYNASALAQSYAEKNFKDAGYTVTETARYYPPGSSEGIPVVTLTDSSGGSIMLLVYNKKDVRPYDPTSAAEEKITRTAALCGAWRGVYSIVSDDGPTKTMTIVDNSETAENPSELYLTLTIECFGYDPVIAEARVIDIKQDVAVFVAENGSLTVVRTEDDSTVTMRVTDISSGLEGLKGRYKNNTNTTGDK